MVDYRAIEIGPKSRQAKWYCPTADHLHSVTLGDCVLEPPLGKSDGCDAKSGPHDAWICIQRSAKYVA